MQAQLHHGSPVMVDYTPAADVSAGDVIVVGNGVRIAHRDIAEGELAASAIAQGVYVVAKDNAAITAGADVYWNAAAGAATATVGENPFMGKAVAAAANTDDTVVVYHMQPAPGEATGD